MILWEACGKSLLFLSSEFWDSFFPQDQPKLNKRTNTRRSKSHITISHVSKADLELHKDNMAANSRRLSRDSICKVRKAGFLVKRAMISGRNWRRRFFELTGTSLQWWSNKEDATKGIAPRNRIILTFQSSVRPLDNEEVDELGYENADVQRAASRFGLEVFVQRGKRLLIYASSEGERDDWLVALQGAIPTVGDAGVALFLRALGNDGLEEAGDQPALLSGAARKGATGEADMQHATPMSGDQSQVRQNLDILKLRGTLRWTPIVGEHLRAAILVDKVNRRGAWQRRELVITETAVYIIGVGNKRGCKR